MGLEQVCPVDQRIAVKFAPRLKNRRPKAAFKLRRWAWKVAGRKEKEQDVEMKSVGGVPFQNMKRRHFKALVEIVQKQIQSASGSTRVELLRIESQRLVEPIFRGIDTQKEPDKPS
jgi:hypothetical protein